MKINKNPKGFTIVELLIATSVFGVVLLVASAGIIAIGRLYHKNITSANVQEVTSSLMSDVSQTIQFSENYHYDDPLADGVPGGPAMLCIGKDRYTFYLNNGDGGGGKDVILSSRPLDNTCPPEPAGQELLGSNDRLLKFAVSGNNPYKIQLRVAHGDDDLLTHYNDDGSDNSAVNVADANCKSGISASIFCSTAQLETSVNKRVE